MPPIPVRVRPKPYSEVNGDEIYLGHDQVSIGYIDPVVWARPKDSPADGPDIALQQRLTQRLAELLTDDPQCQEILAELHKLALAHKDWEAKGGRWPRRED